MCAQPIYAACGGVGKPVWRQGYAWDEMSSCAGWLGVMVENAGAQPVICVGWTLPPACLSVRVPTDLACDGPAGGCWVMTRCVGNLPDQFTTD